MLKSLAIPKITPEQIKKLSYQDKVDFVMRIASAKGMQPQYMNPFDMYEPTPNALYFHRSMADIREFSGGNGAAKTYTATVEDCVYLLGRCPKSMESTWCRPIPKKPVVWRVNGINDDAVFMYLWTAFEMILPPGTIAGRNKEKKILYVKSIHSEYEPSMLQFKTYEMDVDAHSGATLDGIRFDEQPEKIELFHESIKRMRMANPFNIIFSMTAEKGKTWLFDEIDEKARTIYLSVPNKPPVQRLPADAISDEFTRERHIEVQNLPHNFNNNPSIEVINATVYDNPYVSDDYIVKFYNTLKKFPEKLQINILGKTVSLTGLVIPEYRREKHFVNSSELYIDPDYPHFVAIDDHTDFFAYTLACITPKNEVYVVKDRRFTGDLDEICKEIRLLEGEEIEWNGKKEKRWIVWRIADPRVGMKDIRKGRTLIQDMVDSYKTCDICFQPLKEVRSGVEKFGYCAKCKRKQKGILVRASHKDKDRGILLVRKALGEPKLFVCDDAKNTDYEFRHWVYKNNKPKDEDDHWMSNIERLFQEADFRYRNHKDYQKPLDMNRYLWAS